MFNITLDGLVSHQQHEDYQVGSFLGGLRLPAFFQDPQRRIVQVASASQVPFAMRPQKYSGKTCVTVAKQHQSTIKTPPQKTTYSGTIDSR